MRHVYIKKEEIEEKKKKGDGCTKSNGEEGGALGDLGTHLARTRLDSVARQDDPRSSCIRLLPNKGRSNSHRKISSKR